MITIPDLPPQKFCATCSQQLSWLWSPTRQAWVAFIPAAGERWTIRPHPCRHAQDPATWRDLRRVSPETVHRGRQLVDQALKESLHG